MEKGLLPLEEHAPPAYDVISIAWIIRSTFSLLLRDRTKRCQPLVRPCRTPVQRSSMIPEKNESS
jgi:hypothetical protein